MHLKINNKNYKLKFGFGAKRRIVQHYGFKKPSDYEKIIKKLKIDKMGTDPDFPQIEFLAMLFIASMENAGEIIDFSTDDMVDIIVANPTAVIALQEEMQKSQVQPSANPTDKKK